MARKSSPDSFDEYTRPTRAAVPFVTWRLSLLGFILLAGLTVLGMRIYYLTIPRGPYFYELSENNFLFEQPLSAPRGRVFTSDGTALSVNKTRYDIEMSPFRMTRDQIEDSLSQLAKLLDRPEIESKTEEVIKKRPPWEPVNLAEGLDLETIGPVLERVYAMPGVTVAPAYQRFHPLGQLMGHVTGYIRKVDPATLGAHPEKGYLKNDLVGKIGIESQYEDDLRGTHGKEIYIRDARGRPRSSHLETRALRGNDVILTIDLELQTLADDLLTGHRGVAIVLDPRDGAVLALVSKPDYDPNLPLSASSKSKTSSYNKATRGRFAPASTFKLVTASAGLLMGKDPSENGDCDGQYFLPNVKRPFYCDVRSGHGTLDMFGAIQKSCNVYFYRWANQIGRDRMLDTAAAYGFGEPTGIDLQPEGSGHLAEPGSGVYQGSVVQMGIGQGALIAVTPLQLLNAYAALANGGIRYQPHLMKEVRTPSGSVVRTFEPVVQGKLPISNAQRKILMEGFRRVIQTEGGTARGAGFESDWDASGKTGSAELFGQKLTNGWFVAYAPTAAPEIAMIVLVEGEGHGGATAAPIARELMALYFSRKTGKPTPLLPAVKAQIAGAEHPQIEVEGKPEVKQSEDGDSVPAWARRD